jgi:hypothetical protein
MKIPKSVTILGRKFKVHNNLTPEQMKKYVPECPLGAMNYSEKLIAIQAHKCKEEQFVTYFHECCHAAQYISGLNMTINHEMAEVWCEATANMMIDVFKSLK